jgi:hypothetical protein
LEEGLSEGWIDDVLQSPVGNYAFKVPRVGCIIRVGDAHPDQPEESWFVDYAIPVWYRYDDDTSKMGILGATQSETELDGDTEDRLTEPTWVTFIRNREDKYAEIMKNETQEARLRRESRMRDRPIRKATVFEWVQDDEEPMLWERQPVTQKCKMDTLERYDTSQTRYDAFFNEWDCCEDGQFSEPSDDTDPDSDWEQSAAGRSTSVEGEKRSQRVVTVEMETPLHDTEVSPDLYSQPARNNSVQQEVDEVFGDYYGFTPPVLGSVPPNIQTDGRTSDWFERLLGLGREEGHQEAQKQYKESAHYHAVLQFIDGLVKGNRYNEAVYDTMDGSMRPVRLLPRFRAIVKHDVGDVPKNADCLDRGHHLYIFEFEDGEATVPWKLATFSPTTALMICRIPPEFREAAIAFYLAQRGIPFRILHPRPRIGKPAPRLVTHTIPVRQWDHEFTKQDYESYVNHRTYLLGQPQMQAMIRQGGIVWRLSVGTLGVADVAKAPTQWGHVYRTPDGDIEDTATTVEMDLLCGAYECITGESSSHN